MGEETKNESRDERREGDEGAAQKETAGGAGRRKKVGTLPRTGVSGVRKKPHSNGAFWTGTSGGSKWQADKRTEPGLEHPGKKRTRLEHLGGETPRLEHPGRKRPWIGASGAA